MSDTQNNQKLPLIQPDDSQHTIYPRTTSKCHNGLTIYSILIFFTFAYFSFEMLKFDFLCDTYDPFTLPLDFFPNTYGTLSFKIRMICLTSSIFITISSILFIFGSLTEIRLFLWPMKLAQILIFLFSVSIFILLTSTFIQLLKTPYRSYTIYRVHPMITPENYGDGLVIKNDGMLRIQNICYYASKKCDLWKISEFDIIKLQNRTGNYFKFLALIFGQFIFSAFMLNILVNLRCYYKKLLRHSGQTRVYSYESVRVL